MIPDVSAHSLVHKSEIQTSVVAISYQALGPTAKILQVFTEGTDIVPAHRHYLLKYELTKQPINQPINHLSTQPRIRAVISAVMCWLCEKLKDAFQIH
jgi:hypothetical protein